MQTDVTSVMFHRILALLLDIQTASFQPDSYESNFCNMIKKRFVRFYFVHRSFLCGLYNAFISAVQHVIRIAPYHYSTRNIKQAFVLLLPRFLRSIWGFRLGCITQNFTLCPLCDAAEESVEHLFLHCPFISCISRQAPQTINLAALELQSIMEWIKIVLDPSRMLNLSRKLEHSFVLYAVIAMDSIWFARNQVVHNHVPVDPNQILLHIQRSH